MKLLNVRVLSVCFGMALTGCDNTPQVTSTSSGGSNTGGAAATGGATSIGGAACNWGDAGLPEDDASVPSDAGTSEQPPGTCPLMSPTAPLHYPSEQSSPCPAREPDVTSQSRACPRAEIGTRCVYPAPQGSGAEDIWTCVEEGGSYGPDGLLPDSSTVTNWEFEPGVNVCRRTGNDCLIGLDEVCGRTSPRIELTAPCQERQLVQCEAMQDQTVQRSLDSSLGVPVACFGTTYSPGDPSALTVWFNGDCPSSFIVYPAEVADCVKAYLETIRFDCARGLFCGASGMTGGCPC